MRRPATGTVGDLRWTRERRGRLRHRDRARLLGQGIAMQLAQLPWSALAAVGVRPRGRIAFDAEALRLPDSPAARNAEALCDALAPAPLAAHSYRTFAWATILAGHRALRYDEEALYVSSLLHDVGLSSPLPQGAGPDPPAGTCFTLVGAETAERVALANGWDRDRAARAAEAITLHMNLRPPAGATEAQLLVAGAQLDAVGAGHWRLARSTVDSVLRRWPRTGTKAALRDVFRRQAERHPGTRAHFYHRYLGLGTLIRLAPFEE